MQNFTKIVAATSLVGFFASVSITRASEPCDLDQSSQNTIIASSDGLKIIADAGSKNLKVGEETEFKITLCSADSGFELSRIDAWMPTHGHGMNYQPEFQKQADGSYIAAPFLFHMPGPWQLRARIIKDNEQVELTGDFDIMP